MSDTSPELSYDASVPVSEPSSAHVSIDSPIHPVDLSHQADQLVEYEDLFTPEQNAELDAQLLETWDHVKGPMKTSRLIGHILCDIVSSAGPQMKPEFQALKNCVSLCEDNPQLRQALIQAVTKRSFNRIRRLAILREPPAPPRSPRNKVHEEPIPNLGIDAWNREYVGDCHKLLLKNINAMDRGLFYSNTTSIIQSAGTGKSRMVDEQAKLVFTIPFNVGKLYEYNYDAAFPPPDRDIRRYLLEHVASKTSDEIGPIVMHFWICLFLQINSIVREWPSEPTYSALALKWYQYLSTDDHRRKFYESVVTCARATEQQRSPLPAARVTASCTLSALVQTIDKHVIESSKDEFQNMVKVMIYFDEAHVLAETLIAPTPRSANNSSYTSSPPKQTSSDPFLSQQLSTESPNRPRLSLYDIMLWSFHDFENIHVFVLFLSRKPLSTLVPPASEEDHRVSDSARRRHNGSPYFQAPITETSFDECPSLHIKAGDVCISRIQQIQFLAQFGRPLFWTTVDVIESSRKIHDPSSHVFSLAQMGLTNLTSSSNLNPSIALLDIRLMFDYRSDSELARKTQEDLISNHMRLAYSLTQNREHLQSGYSSEPLIAEVAARMMHKKLNSDPAFTIKTLREIMSLGIINFGQRGELIGRALIMQAYDAAVSMKKSKYHTFSAGCTVTNFVKALFVPPIAADILNSISSNGDGKRFKETFAHARMRFTHFVKITDNGILSPDGAFAAFVRGFGIICPDHEGGIDLALPVAMVDNEDTPLSPSIMTVLLVRVMRTSTKGATNLCRLDEAAIDFFPPGSAADKPVPYISLIMELGALTTDLNRAGMPTNLHKIVPTTRSQKAGTKPNSAAGSAPPMTRKRKAEQSELASVSPSKVRIRAKGKQPIRRASVAAHPCYSIHAFGCSRKVYSVIGGGWQEYDYTALLAGHGLLASHPRRDKDSLEHVRKMKPWWAWDNDSYHWIDLKEGDSEIVCSDTVISGVPEEPLYRID